MRQKGMRRYTQRPGHGLQVKLIALEPEDPDKSTQSPENKKKDDKSEKKRQKLLANEKGNHDIGGKKEEKQSTLRVE